MDGPKHHTTGVLDEEFGQRSVFPGIDANILKKRRKLHTGLPLSAHDYILGVMSEARTGPRVVSCQRKEALVMPGRKRALRSYEDDMPERKPVVKARPETGRTGDDLEPIVPVRIDRRWSDQFLARITDENRLYVNTKEADSGLEYPSNSRDWRLFLLDQPPSLQLLKNIKISTALNLLRHYRKWISPSMNDKLITWLFALLTRLPHILCSDDISCLRELARRAHKTLLKDGCSSSLEAILSGILVMTTEIYKQKDLCELFIYEKRSQ